MATEDERQEPRGETDEDNLTNDPDGESKTVSPTAPPSAGKPHGDEGELDPEHSPDLRPQDPEQAPSAVPRSETAVSDPSNDESRRTGSAGAASIMAGSKGPDEPE